MSLRLLAAIIGLQLAGSGCLLDKPGSRLLMAPEQEEAFKRECLLLRAAGDIGRLNARIDRDVTKILDLADTDHPSAVEARVRNLVADISSCVDSIKMLIQPQWTAVKWTTEQVWELGANDLALMGASCEVREKRFTGYDVVQVYWDGAPHPELIPAVRVALEPHRVRFSIELSQSTLSLCELLKVTGVQVRVNVNLCGEPDWREFRLSLSNPS